MFHSWQSGGMRPEQRDALLGPVVASVDQVGAEQLDCVLVATDRGWRKRPRPRQQLGRPLLDVDRRPVPRVGATELHEAAHISFPGPDRHRCQQPGRLLPSPAGEHVLEDLLRGPQQRPRSPGRSDVTVPGPSPSRSSTRSSLTSNVRSVHQMYVREDSRRSATRTVPRTRPYGQHRTRSPEASAAYI